MKIITLNTWGGIAGKEKILKFFKDHQDVDIFCLQEVFDGGENEPEEKAERIEQKVYELFSEIKESLPNHKAFFRPHLNDYYGLAMFVKKDIELVEEGQVFVHKFKDYSFEGRLGHHARNIQYVKVRSQDKEFVVINFHGLWNGQGKGDSDARIQQSEKIVSFVKSQDTENFLLCGDFNLSPDTQSLKMIEEISAKNLVNEYGITSTRTSLYTKENKFADYMFTGSGIVVKDFKVLPDEVSDHSPLFIEIA